MQAPRRSEWLTKTLVVGAIAMGQCVADVLQHSVGVAFPLLVLARLEFMLQCFGSRFAPTFVVLRVEPALDGTRG